MNRNKKTAEHNQKAANYLRSLGNAYVRNIATGIYQAHSEHINNETRTETVREVESAPPQSNWAERFSAIFAGIGVIVSIFTLIGLFVTALIYTRQWEQSHRAADAAIDQSQLSLEALTESQRANRKQASDSRRALGFAQDTFKLDERAWLELREDKPPFPLEETKLDQNGSLAKQFEVSFDVANVGKTFAHAITVKARSLQADDKFVDVKSKIYKELSGYDLGGKKTLIADEPTLIATELGPNSVTTVPFRVKVGEPRGQVPGGYQVDYIVGRVDYIDVFSKYHWITFCFRTGIGARLTNCSFGNAEGNENERYKGE